MTHERPNIQKKITGKLKWGLIFKFGTLFSHNPQICTFYHWRFLKKNWMHLPAEGVRFRYCGVNKQRYDDMEIHGFSLGTIFTNGGFSMSVWIDCRASLTFYTGSPRVIFPRCFLEKWNFSLLWFMRLGFKWFAAFRTERSGTYHILYTYLGYSDLIQILAREIIPIALNRCFDGCVWTGRIPTVYPKMNQIMALVIGKIMVNIDKPWNLGVSDFDKHW